MSEMPHDTVRSTLAAAQRCLLQQRNSAGHWEGELSASALSTAIAVAALSRYQRALPSPDERYTELIDRGLEWLVASQNADGGWGDTTLSFSNISTTAICWATFAIANADDRFPDTVNNAADWLQSSAGSLEPATLARAIADRYGKDRTFSVPILTTLAIGGRLGDERGAWRLVPQLPFELAAFPQRWFHWMQLPVVSYALPALIAIGQVRHHRCPTWNPILRGIRASVRNRTLRTLAAIQPESGGYLEATPLTSFVVLSLVHAENVENTVVRDGVRFLIESVRDDGSWPIDTNLATWVTTLSVNALATSDSGEPTLSAEQCATIKKWLLGQQYRTEHPYTLAAPGAWAWTDLTGGVPDADDTPGALLALSHLGLDDPDCRAAAEAGTQWLLDLQNGDGGIPTFCHGWGNLPFDRSSPDLSAHAIRAWAVWRDQLSPSLQKRVDVAIQRALRFLAGQQRENGSWVPLWFGNQFTASEENPTYGTSRVLLSVPAVACLHGASCLNVPRAVIWLLSIQNEDGGWGGDRDTPSTIEETAFSVEAFARLLSFSRQSDASVPWICHEAAMQAAMRRGADWLAQATAGGTEFPPSPIGFYFAKLWYFEMMYPIVFAIAALGSVAAVLDQQGSEVGVANTVDNRDG